MLSQYKLKDYNFRLIIPVVLLSILGILLVGSADASLQSRQMYGVIAGLAVMVVVSLVDYSWILNFSWILYFVNIGLLILVVAAGRVRKGASRWISIGGLQFQPTELTKIFLILFFSMYFMKHENTINTRQTLIRSFVLMVPSLVLILMQPDLKNTITIAVILFILLFAAGLSYKRMGIILATIAAVAVLILLLVTKTDLPILKEYQRNRIITFFSMDSGEYSESAIQQENSIMAIGSGELTGKGLNNNKVSSSNKGNFVAELQNDFIFAVAGEELGFIGCVFIILLLFLVVAECIRMGQRAKDLSGTLICDGIASLIAIQSFINICVATGLFPNTGTPLPFVSYGLTSLFSLFLGIGLVLNVGLQNRNYFSLEGTGKYAHNNK
ncbi:MAG: FtsW/RodA/SpoVE family cell cycle protein [Bilifractor sp.]|jgi:rod shape determining protein RodA